MGVLSEGDYCMGSLVPWWWLITVIVCMSVMVGNDGGWIGMMCNVTQEMIDNVPIV